MKLEKITVAVGGGERGKAARHASAGAARTRNAGVKNGFSAVAVRDRERGEAARHASAGAARAEVRA